MLALPRRGDELGCRAQMAVIKAQSGDKSAAVQILTELEELRRHSYVPAYFRALLCLSLGNRDEAIRWLEQSVTAAVVPAALRPRYNRSLPVEESDHWHFQLTRHKRAHREGTVPTTLDSVGGAAPGQCRARSSHRRRETNAMTRFQKINPPCDPIVAWFGALSV